MSPARTRRAAPSTQRFSAGPWKGVRTTTDALDDPPDLLMDAVNLYIPDPLGASGAYARPGMALLNNGNALVTSASAFRGQCVFTYTSLAGATTNFIVMGGKVFRVDGQLGAFVDVTPVGVTIDASTTTRVYALPFLGQLILTDGVNRPWLATNLSSTPITGTYLDFDGLGTAWSAFGPPTVYAGSVFFILNSVGGVSARTDIAWSAPGDASIGYQQAAYDYRWTLAQTASDPLFALCGTNVGLYYWRERAIGAVAGEPTRDFQGSTTDDAVGVNVGTQAPQSIVQFGNSIYFTDAIGRPCRLPIGGQPEPIWLNMRAVVDAQVGFPSITQTTTTACFEPTLNLYLVAIWSSTPSRQAPPVEAYAFDAQSGMYMGRWVIGPGCQIEAMGTLLDVNGRRALVVLGSKIAPTGTMPVDSGFAWAMNSLIAIGDYLTTEDTVPDFLTTEDGVALTTEGTSVNWLDGDSVPTISATTTRIGYASDRVLNVDRATLLTGSAAPCAVSMLTASVATTVEGTPSASAAQDGIYRLIVGADGIQGRGVEVTASPTTAAAQWNLQTITVDAVVSLAGPEEP